MVTLVFLLTSGEFIDVVKRLLVATVPAVVCSNGDEWKCVSVELVTTNVGLLVEVTDRTSIGFSSLE